MVNLITYGGKIDMDSHDPQLPLISQQKDIFFIKNNYLLHLNLNSTSEANWAQLDWGQLNWAQFNWAQFDKTQVFLLWYMTTLFQTCLHVTTGWDRSLCPWRHSILNLLDSDLMDFRFNKLGLQVDNPVWTPDIYLLA